MSQDKPTSNNAASSLSSGNTDPGTTTAAATPSPTPLLPSPAVVPSDSISTSPAPQQEDLPAKKKRKGFEGGITIGPDVNIASSMKMGRIGLGAGIILRYHFNDRWSVQTGAILSKKRYGATPDDYHFDYPVTYTKIDADCNVLDVPLNVSYTFLEKKRNRWSAVAGASSYFMLNEKYDYFYANGTKRSHAYKNQNQHYFSVLNLGVNWERQTGSRLKWSLQPYVKVPLGGVGQGKVKLYSAGLALQVTMGKR
ncbi:porin family protein [Chitinophaga cymbidii]|nr:porin family protein [Chitinophaga cymbidii]